MRLAPNGASSLAGPPFLGQEYFLLSSTGHYIIFSSVLLDHISGQIDQKGRHFNSVVKIHFLKSSTNIVLEYRKCYTVHDLRYFTAWLQSVQTNMNNEIAGCSFLKL